MAKYSDRQQREIFHFMFLERLLKISDPRLFALKGGVNLRFFFKSPRYSEDMDLDVFGGSVTTLKKNGYKILDDHSFRRTLQTYGIEKLETNNPDKAKHTATTQRFKLKLFNEAGESFPTKVEFSRRATKDESTSDTIDPFIAKSYQRIAFQCQHYSANVATKQKIRAIAQRSKVQSRDPFDIYILWLGGNVDIELVRNCLNVDFEKVNQKLSLLSYVDYEGQVVEFLQSEDRKRFESEVVWDEIVAIVRKIIDPKSSDPKRY